MIWSPFPQKKWQKKLECPRTSNSWWSAWWRQHFSHTSVQTVRRRLRRSQLGVPNDPCGLRTEQCQISSRGRLEGTAGWSPKTWKSMGWWEMIPLNYGRSRLQDSIVNDRFLLFSHELRVNIGYIGHEYVLCMVWLCIYMTRWFVGQMLVNMPYMEHMGYGTLW